MLEIITTGHCSSCRGINISGTGSVQDDDGHYRLRFRRNTDCGFDIFFVKHVLEL